MNFLIYFYIVLYILFDIWLFSWAIELMVRAARRMPPQVPSHKIMRRAVVDEIKQIYPNTKTIIDIGSGWGGMVKMAARNFPNATVTGIEIMPTTFIFSSISCMFLKNARFKYSDIYKFLVNADSKFDVGIAYLLPNQMQRIEDLMSKFKYLFVLDFALPNKKPFKKIKLNKNYLGQHWLYIYKSK